MIKLQYELAKNKMVNGDGHNHLKVEVQVENQKTKSTRQLPVALVLCMDGSGSMNDSLIDVYSNQYMFNGNPQAIYGNQNVFSNGYGQINNVRPQRSYENISKMDYAKSSAIKIVESLNKDDYFGLVMFNGLAYTIVELKQIGNRKEEIIKKINSISANGSTNMYDGLRKVEEEFDKIDANVIKKTIILSDGEVNAGVRDMDAFATKSLELFNKKQIHISSIGYGKTYNLELMSQLANNGEGNFYHLKEAEEIYKIIEEELSIMNAVVAQKAELSITIPVGFTVDENINNYVEKYDGNQIKINLGNLYNSKYIIFPIHLLKNLEEEKATFPLTLHYIDESEQEVTLKKEVVIEITNDKQELIKENKTIVSEVTDTVQRKALIQATVEIEKTGAYSSASSYMNVSMNALSNDFGYSSVADSTNIQSFNSTMSSNMNDVDALRSLNSRTMKDLKNRNE
jgi:hypothetical protein